MDLSTNYFILSNLTDFDYIFKEWLSGSGRGNESDKL